MWLSVVAVGAIKVQCTLFIFITSLGAIVWMFCKASIELKWSDSLFGKPRMSTQKLNTSVGFAGGTIGQTG